MRSDTGSSTETSRLQLQGASDEELGQPLLLRAPLLIIAVGLGIAFWFLDSVIDSVIFSERGVWDEATSPEPVEIWMRTVVFTLLLLFAGYAQAPAATQRRRTLRALRQSEARMRTILFNAPVVLFSTDREGMITFAEGTGLNATGLTSTDLVGNSVFEVFQDHPTITDNIRRALAGETFTTRGQTRRRNVRGALCTRGQTWRCH